MHQHIRSRNQSNVGPCPPNFNLTLYLRVPFILKKFLTHILLPYILVGCSRDGPPYPVELNIRIVEQDQGILTTQPMRVGLFREGGLPPFDRPVLFTHLRTDQSGTLRVRVELPQPPIYYFLWIDSMPTAYTNKHNGAALNHKMKQFMTLFVDSP